MERSSEHVAHLLTDEGVTAVRFEQVGPAEWRNLDAFTLRQGDVLDFGTVKLRIE